MELPPPPPPPPERSKRLHNFTLPYLRWGHQRFLRCVKLPNNLSPSSSPSPDHRSSSIPIGIELVPSVEARNGDVASVAVAAAAKPWNLRTRRAACNEPGDESVRIVESSSLLRRHEIAAVGEGIGDSQKNDKGLKFSVSLMRDEIEEDFTALIGKRPPRRPKKRPRLVQKQINTIFPGLWLAEEVTASSYDAAET
ncbi:unnamed protein product [Cochlearia groenlandica]